jgi:hypothetical protein
VLVEHEHRPENGAIRGLVDIRIHWTKKGLPTLSPLQVRVSAAYA